MIHHTTLLNLGSDMSCLQVSASMIHVVRRPDVLIEAKSGCISITPRPVVSFAPGLAAAVVPEAVSEHCIAGTFVMEGGKDWRLLIPNRLLRFASVTAQAVLLPIPAQSQILVMGPAANDRGFVS